MPELPEVETIVRQLSVLIPGQCINKCRIKDKKITIQLRKLLGLKIVNVKRFGKKIVLTIQGQKKHIFLVIHLRITGRLLYYEHKSAIPKDPHERMKLCLDQGILRFSDVRRFGTVELLNNNRKLYCSGIDPLYDKLTLAIIDKLIGTSNQNIKAWLLRQDRIVGIGNIYASEILFDAGISPLRQVGSLKKEEKLSLKKSIKQIIRRAVKAKGTTISDFQDSYGVTGKYQKNLKVYGQENKPCPKCHQKIIKIIQQQRSTFFCKKCQS